MSRERRSHFNSFFYINKVTSPEVSGWLIILIDEKVRSGVSGVCERNGHYISNQEKVEFACLHVSGASQQNIERIMFTTCLKKSTGAFLLNPALIGKILREKGGFKRYIELEISTKVSIQRSLGIF